MHRRTVIAAVIIVALSFSLVAGLKVVDAQSYQAITIKSDGSIDPSTNLLERNGTKYTFNGDIFGSIMVQTGYITIDGAGHALQGNGIDTGQNTEIGILLSGPDLSHRDCRGVLVENLRILNIPRGIYSVGGSNNSFVGNYFDESGVEIQGNANGTGDLIKHNIFINASLMFDYTPYGTDRIEENSFFNSTLSLWLSEAPIVDRNYWSDYATRYPNASEIDNAGIGNTPYVFSTVQNGAQPILYQDNHPLMTALGSALGILDLEQAAALASNIAAPGKWRWSLHWHSSSFQTAPLVTTDGLVSGHLEWNQNGSLFEAVYPSGQVMNMIERFEGLNESDEYYVWSLTLKDHSQVWMDARNGDILTGAPARVPGLLQFDVAVRITQAASPKTDLWDVLMYEPLANGTWSSGETDGTNVGHFLWRTSDGTFTEEFVPVGPVPTPGPSPRPIFRIQVSNDTEEYYVWEIRTVNQTFYIDERDGAIRYIIANADIPSVASTPNQTPLVPEFPAATIVLVVLLVALTTALFHFRKTKNKNNPSAFTIKMNCFDIEAANSKLAGSCSTSEAHMERYSELIGFVCDGVRIWLKQ